MDEFDEARQLALQALTTELPPGLLHEPIEFVFADHFRQRILCDVLDQIADTDEPDKDLLDAALSFLRGDFGLHVMDEEEDLFPLLRRRAEPEDQIDEVLGQLSEEHASDETDAKQIIHLLENLKGVIHKPCLSSEQKSLLTRFAANERQHLIVENAIVLPLARTRLSDADKQELGIRMAARRGLGIPERAHD